MSGLEQPPEGNHTEKGVKNRDQRRRGLKGATPLHRDTIRAGMRLDQVAREIRETGAIHQEDISKFDGNITRIVYQGEPFMHRYLAAMRNLPSYIAEAYRSNASDPHLNLQSVKSFERHDIFSRRIGGNYFMEGTTLFDIEQMPLGPEGLAPEDISRINRMLRTGIIFYRRNPEHDMVRYAMVYLATQKFARPSEINIPPQIQNLDARLTAYFDYHTQLLVDSSLTEDEEDHLLLMFTTSKPWLPEALGCFIPARLGITPSSAIKLYYRHALNTGMISKRIWERRLLSYFEVESRNAFRVNNLPPDLKKYQHYDPKIDAEASSKLIEHYSETNLSLDSGKGQSLEEVLDQISQYRQALYSRAVRSREKNWTKEDRVEVDFPDSFFASKMTVTAQYPNTLMFILHFNGQTAHLTLELDRDKNLFGLPPKADYENPHLADLITRDIVHPLLARLRSNFPYVERSVYPPIPNQIERPPTLITDFKGTQIGKLHSVTYNTLSPLRVYLEGPKPPVHLEVHRRQRNVSYTRKGIVRLLGRNTKEDLIDRVMNGIRDFEYGRGDFKKLTDLGLWEIRIGDYRVILKQEENLHSVVRVVPRKDLEKTLANL